MSGTRDSTTQLARTQTPNKPPAYNFLKDGELFIEQNDPVRVWVGVPAALDTTGRRLVFDRSVLSTVWMGSTPPAEPPSGALWWCPDDGNLYCWYDDGTSIQWVPATSVISSGAGSAGVTSFNTRAGAITLLSADVTSALTFTPYNATNPAGYQTAANVTTALAPYATTASVQTAVAIAQNSSNRNKIHNSCFTVAQRGAGPWSVTGYTLDRWNLITNTDTVSVVQAAMGDSGRAAIGDEEAGFYLANTFTGNAAAGASTRIQQPVEGVKRLANKSVIISFWAVASSGTPKLGINMVQNFGSGGSPSSNVIVLATGNAVTLSTTWTRYSTTIAVPSVAGKTLGTTANTDLTSLQLWYSSGATNNAQAGNIGVQSAAISLWGVQLEIAAPGQTLPTILEKFDPQVELSNCQRFYYPGQMITTFYAAAGGGTIYYSVGLPTTMRGLPQVTVTNTSTGNATLGTPGAYNASTIYVTATTTAAGAGLVACTFTATADL